MDGEKLRREQRGGEVSQIQAVIADDEAPLRVYLRTLLQTTWPELVICAEVANGDDAIAAVAKYGADIAFLDIRMPGMSGLEAARSLPAQCRVVFVTAYDSYAVEAFEQEALDYLLKPVTPERLATTISRLRERMEQGAVLPGHLSQVVETILARQNDAHQNSWLHWLRVQHGDGVRLIGVGDVLYFRAEDKYTAVVTPEGEFLIRTPIKTLIRELDPDMFWQIHRSTIVRVDRIESVSRSLTGRFVVRLQGVGDEFVVSRAYGHLFKQM